MFFGVVCVFYMKMGTLFDIFVYPYTYIAQKNLRFLYRKPASKRCAYIFQLYHFSDFFFFLYNDILDSQGEVISSFQEEGD